MTVRLMLNGRFLARPLTGVDRIAVEVARELAGRRIAGGEAGLSVVVPRGGGAEARSALRKLSIDCTIEEGGRGKGQLWEQTTLQLFRKGATLLSLCNMGPLFRRNQLLCVADAQVVTQPRSYRLAFRAYFRLLLPIVSRTCRHLITISEHSRRELEQAGIFPRGKAHVIHCGSDHIDSVAADPAVLARHAIEPGSFFLLVGSLAPHKNMQLILDTLSGHMPDGAKLFVAGGGNARVFQASQTVVAGDVIYAGRVTDGELVALYRTARALIFPSLTEGFGLPPVEAMRCGCPVIASTGGAIPEVCGDAALYVEPRSADGWLAAVHQIWSDPALSEELRAKGARRCQDFTWRAATDKLLAILDGDGRDG